MNQFSLDDPSLYITVTWNAALKEATGDYVWIQEDDDFLADDYAEKMVALFEENPECTTAAGLPVSVEQLWVLHVVEMNVGVDEVKFGHVVARCGGENSSLFNHLFAIAVAVDPIPIVLNAKSGTFGNIYVTV